MELVLPGVMGGILGAYLLSSLPGEKIKPFLSFYLLLMGLCILYRAFEKAPQREGKSRRFLTNLGFL